MRSTRGSRADVNEPSPLLAVEDLKTPLLHARRRGRAVDGVSFTIQPGETLALVGDRAAARA